MNAKHELFLTFFLLTQGYISKGVIMMKEIKKNYYLSKEQEVTFYYSFK